MKKLFILVFILLDFPGLIAQEKSLEERIKTADSLFNVRQYTRAINLYTKLIPSFENDQRKSEELAGIYDQLGYYYNSVEQNYNLAQTYYTLSLTARSTRSENLWKSYYNLASVAFRKKEVLKTIAYVDTLQRTESFRSTKSSTKAFALFMKGVSYKYRYKKSLEISAFDSSMSNLQNSMAIWQQAENQLWANASMEMADLYLANQNSAETLSSLKSIENSSYAKSLRYITLLKRAYLLEGNIDSAFAQSESENKFLRERINSTNIESVAKITEDYRTDKQLDQAEETAFLASQRAKTYGKVASILLLTLAISYLIFLQTIQRKKLENLQAVVLGEEQERRRLAKDLHDGIGVLLTSIRMRLSSFEEKVDDQEAYHQSLEQIDNACTEVRRVSHNLSPASLEKLGLEEAILDLVDQINLTGDVEIKEELALDRVKIQSKQEVLIYRIVQELINNSLKYAEASQLNLSLKEEAQSLKLQFRDNGKGFDKQKVKPGLGLKSIASRLDILKGKMAYHSQPGQGAQFDIIIPING